MCTVRLHVLIKSHSIASCFGVHLLSHNGLRPIRAHHFAPHLSFTQTPDSTRLPSLVNPSTSPRPCHSARRHAAWPLGRTKPSHNFGYPGCTAEELKMVGETVDNVKLQGGDVVYPLVSCLPMRFAGSLWMCRRASLLSGSVPLGQAR